MREWKTDFGPIGKTGFEAVGIELCMIQILTVYGDTKKKRD